MGLGYNFGCTSGVATSEQNKNCNRSQCLAVITLQERKNISRRQNETNYEKKHICGCSRRRDCAWGLCGSAGTTRGWRGWPRPRVWPPGNNQAVELDV